MTATPERLFARLAELGIESRTFEHAAVFTVEEARTHRGQIAGAHTKNLFLKDKRGRLFLAVTLEDTALDLAALAPLIAAGRLSFGPADLLRAHLGVEPGSVTPFALLNDGAQAVTPVLDQAMLERQLLNFHPLVNTATTSIAASDLLRFITACGHRPLILRFPLRPQPV
jgi:Ala-tRNA(Pro) deacylase